MKKPQRDAQHPKKPYVKPEARKVFLKLDEAVLGVGCKTAADAAGGQTGSLCAACALSWGS